MSNIVGNGPTDPRGVYNVALADVVGVVAANTYLAMFNPGIAPGSTLVHIALQASVAEYSVGVTSTAASMIVQRFTGISGGTIMTPSTIGRFLSSMPNPRTLVYTGGPTITGTSLVQAAFPPPIGNGPGTSSSGGRVPVTGASFIMLPGEGLAFSTTVGDINQRWNFQYVWEEI